MTYLPPRIIPYPLTHQSGDSQLGIDTNGIGDCNNPVLFGDGEEPIPVLVVLTGKQWERIYGALLFGADVIYPNAREQVLFDFTKWWDCPLDICQIIQDCIGAQLEAIQASVDALSTSVTNISNTVNNIENSTDSSATKPPTGITFTDASFRCGGALALVDYMHAQNMAIYAEAEASAVDNISEMIIAVLKSIPALETLPVGALGALTQSYFENQVATYEADFALARIPMASLLACLVELNDNELTYDVWGDWLNTVEGEVPSNTAAELFARYSPARQTIINQIAALLNADQSLQSYFNQLFIAYGAGEDNPSNACDTCGWEQIFDFTAGQQGWTIPQPTQTVYVAGVGFRTSASGFGQVLIQLNTADRSYPAMHVKMEFDTVAGAIAIGNRYHSYYNNGGIVQSNNFDQLTNTTGEQIREIDTAAISPADRIEIGAGARNSGSGSITLKKVTYTGAGVNPFI